jgi:TrmH family RNA methyltransferase
MDKEIQSLQNPRIKMIVRLRARGARDLSGDMIIDGEKAIFLAIKNGFDIRTVYFHGIKGEEELLDLAKAQSISLCPVSAAVFDKISYGNISRGFVALAGRPDFDMKTLPESSALDRYLIAVSFEKPGNIGAVFRSADAAGRTALIAAGGLADIFSPNVSRSSMGTIFTVPAAVVNDEKLAVKWLKDRGIPIYAAVPGAGRSLFELDLSSPCAFAVGNEHSGLSEIWTEDPYMQKVSIPMHGQADSLNAAQTATILIYESLRQSGLKSAG